MDELKRLFLVQTDHAIDTGKFMTKLAELLSSDDAQFTHVNFEVFVTKLTCKYGKCLVDVKMLDQTQILTWLFDYCGTGAGEIVKVDCYWKPTRPGLVRWVYGIHIDVKE